MMTYGEFIKELTNIESNIRKINGNWEKTNRWEAVSRIESELSSFRMTVIREDYVYISYENYISSMGGYFQRNDAKLICLLMILYTNVLYYTVKAKGFVNTTMYNDLCKEKARLGKSIYQMCTTGYEDKDGSLSKNQCNVIKKFIDDSIPQLHHCTGPIGEYSIKVIPEDSERLKEIRDIYESFKIKRKYAYFYDEILNENKKVPINSVEFIYAIMMFFSQVYVESIIWLKKYDPTKMWCPITVWKIIKELRELLINICWYAKYR